MLVRKRDNGSAIFDKNAIEDAILCAMNDTSKRDEDLAKEIALNTQSHFEGKDDIPILDIQDYVERRLMCSSRKDVAKAYIEYRTNRDTAREMKSNLLSQIGGLMGGTDKGILTENANKDARTIPTKRDLLAGIISKHYALKHILPKSVSDAHIAGKIHYHDLDYSPFGSSFNCCLPDIKGMFRDGFKLGNAEIESPRSITTAAAVVSQIIAQVSSHTYGGTTIGWLDQVLEPYAELSYQKHLEVARSWIDDPAKHELFATERTNKEIHDAMQSIEYEANTAFTANGQSPFITIGFGLGTSRWAREIQKGIFNIRIGGLGKNKHTAIFPKLVYTIKDGVNHEKTDPNYDIRRLALKCASERMYPDILNYDQLVDITGGFTPPMGCRSFLHPQEGLPADDMDGFLGRMNLGVVSVNLPNIGIAADCNLAKFYDLLDDRLKICKEALLTRVDRLATVQAKEAPILYMNGAMGLRLEEDELVLPYLKPKASISLGYIGINEMANAMFPDEPHIYDSVAKYKFGLAVLEVLNEACRSWTEETGYSFSVYSTPAENLCRRFKDLDTKEFGSIPGVTDKEYYTNSFHLEVNQNVNPYDKIDFERPFIKYANAGFISYGEYPNMRNNLDALDDVWYYSYGVTPYYGTNTPIDRCYECGYQGEFLPTSKGFECPSCGNHGPNKNVLRRVCGYLGEADTRPFNDGKQSEMIDRVKHL